MNLHENTDFGRKVFFLNTTYEFQQTVVPALFNKEYEVYTISDYRRAKAVLKNFPDSICFIDVDDALTPNGWFNFMESFENDEMLSTIFLGIISSTLGYAQKMHFLMQSVVPAGFIGLNQPHDDLIEQIRNILDLNGAKGRRRFVRADCLDDTRIGIFFDFGEKRFTARVKDISSAGLSCIVSLRYQEFFKINMLIREFSLIIDNETYKCSAAVLKAFVTGDDKLTVVIVFTQAISFNVRKSIREYLQSFLQGRITKIAHDTIPDQKDYTLSNNGSYILDEPEEAEEVTEEYIAAYNAKAAKKAEAEKAAKPEEPAAEAEKPAEPASPAAEAEAPATAENEEPAAESDVDTDVTAAN